MSIEVFWNQGRFCQGSPDIFFLWRDFSSFRNQVRIFRQSRILFSMPRVFCWAVPVFFGGQRNFPKFFRIRCFSGGRYEIRSDSCRTVENFLSFPFHRREYRQIFLVCSEIFESKVKAFQFYFIYYCSEPDFTNLVRFFDNWSDFLGRASIFFTFSEFFFLCLYKFVPFTITKVR